MKEMKKIEYEFTRQRTMPGFDGKTCKTSPVICTDGKTTFLTYSNLVLTGADVFTDKFIAKSTDGGKTFSEPQLQVGLPDVYENGMRISYGAGLNYNKTLKKWFGLGVTILYENDKHPFEIDGVSPNKPFYCEFDPENCRFINPRPVELPFEYVCGYNFGQFIELENGDILIAFNFTTEENTRMMVVTVRYSFTDNGLKCFKVGKPIMANGLKRGICEPSLAHLNGKFYITLRSDEVGLYAVSDDGYNFCEPKPYVWDDGSVLENYNTQQHWMRNKEGLFLAYTRKGAHNDHVFRHRAPIFMTRFDEERECLICDEEVILVPELGARLGNFCVIEANENESWLVTAEWMQSWGEQLGICEKYGSDNSIWIAKVYWKN